MINPIDKILTEWAFRVHNGMPDPKDNYHLIHLKESMEFLKVNNDVINIVMNNLRQIKELKQNLNHLN